MEPTRKNQEEIAVKGKIVSFVRYGDEMVGLSQLGTGIYHNSKTKETQTY